MSAALDYDAGDPYYTESLDNPGGSPIAGGTTGTFADSAFGLLGKTLDAWAGRDRYKMTRAADIELARVMNGVQPLGMTGYAPNYTGMNLQSPTLNQLASNPLFMLLGLVVVGGIVYAIAKG